MNYINSYEFIHRQIENLNRRWCEDIRACRSSIFTFELNLHWLT